VCVKAVNSDNSKKDKPKGIVIGIDRLQIYPLEGVQFFGNCDFTEKSTQEKIMQELKGKEVNCVLSDMVF
jgi:23S rRNA U2552 (ribose-2'-O)-methylase RlmE/FtsJ